MKLVFAHDHIFYSFEDKYYSSGGLSKEMLDRYTQVFDEVTVISRQKQIKEFNNNLTLASTKNVSFVEIPNYKSLKSYFKIHEAREKIKKEIIDGDALIARLPSSIGSLAVTIAQKIDKPYLIEMVACPWDSYWNHSLFGKIFAPYMYLNTKKKVYNSKYVIYVTNEFLQKRYPTRGKHVNCSNVELIENNEEILNRRLENIRTSNKNEKFKIGTVASVNMRYKGQKSVIKALGKLKEQGYTNYEYQLVGGGDQGYLNSIAKKYNVTNQVKFLGSLPHKEVLKWMDTLDIYIQPSKTEGLPRALIEAMSRGVYSIGSNAGGIPELLEKNNIFSKNRKNYNEIANILINLNKETLIRESKRNFYVSKEYEKNKIQSRRKAFLQLLLINKSED